MMNTTACLDLARAHGFLGAGLVPDSENTWLVLAWPIRWFEAWPKGYGQVCAHYIEAQTVEAATLALLDDLKANGLTATEAPNSTALKPLAVKAGLGLQGKHTILFNDRWGSSMALRAILLAAKLPAVDAGCRATPCGDCNRCVQACPTGALDGKTFCRDNCLRQYMIAPKPCPEEMRPMMGQRLIGCEICQRACPRNAVVPQTPPPHLPVFQLEQLLVCDRPVLDELEKPIGTNYAKRGRILAQALIAAGNLGEEMYRDAVEALQNDENATVAEHAQWALSKLNCK